MFVASAAELRAKFLVSFESHLRQAVSEGVPAATIPTPFLCIDDTALRRNMSTMKSFVQSVNSKREREGLPAILLRPHAKMHKSARIARLLMDEGGAVGVCVQKLSEAQVLSGYFAGSASLEGSGGPSRYVHNIYISNEVGVDKNKLRQVAQLALYLKGFPDGCLALCVDSVAGVEGLADALRTAAATDVHVLMEVDVGQNRAGVVGGGEDLVAVGNAIKRNSDVLRFVGIHAYHGGAQHVRLAAERAAVIQASSERARQALSRLKNECGLSSDFVTGAGTGTFAFEGSSNIYRELQPGSYLVLDRDYAENEPIPGAPRFHHSLYLCTSVISLSREARRITFDAGHKSSALDSGPPCLAPSFVEDLILREIVASASNTVATAEDAAEYAETHFVTVANGGDDHMLLRWGPQAPEVKVQHGFTPRSATGYEAICRFIATGLEEALFRRLEVGSRMWLVPGHCDPTINLHDYIYLSPSVTAASTDVIVNDVFMIDARGCQQ